MIASEKSSGDSKQKIRSRYKGIDPSELETTLTAMGYPEFFHFLFSPEDLVFGIEPCGIDDGGAKRLPDNLTGDHYDIKSKDLVRFVFETCGWKKKLTYRVPGVRKVPDSHVVYFDLRQALEVHEGRTKPAY